MGFEADSSGLGKHARQSVAGLSEPAAAGDLAGRLSMLLDAIDQNARAICTSVELATEVAFGAAFDAVPFSELIVRCAHWIDQIETLPKWIAYRLQADRLQEVGLAEFVARLADGRLEAPAARDEFDMAYYEAVLRAMAVRDPEILAFDGHMHSRKIEEFKRLDLLRIDLARLEVAAAHHRSLPAQDRGPDRSECCEPRPSNSGVCCPFASWLNARARLCRRSNPCS